METAPPPVDTLDFQFKLACRLKVFQETSATFDKHCSLVAAASRYGLLFVGSNSSCFQVIQLENIQKYSSKDGDIDNYYRRNITLPSSPQHLCVNCDCTKLAVVLKDNDRSKAIIYDVASFLQQNVSVVKEIILSLSPNVNVLESVWNPALPSLYTVCKSDGSLGVYDLQDSGIEINELPPNTKATCMCWSPKGKQIAVGSADGKITQYKPDLKVAKVTSGPTLENSSYPVALQWISNYQFIAMYSNSGADTQFNLIVVNCPKGADVTYTNYEDICYSNGKNRPPQFYTILQNVWNILLVASANSMEVGVLGFDNKTWIQWILTDSARAELPLSAAKQDTLPIGMCLDTSQTHSLPWGENTVPPAPLLLLLSHHGVLCCFHTVNLKEGATPICQAPEVLPNSASNNFVMSSGQVASSSSKEAVSTGNIFTTQLQPAMPSLSFNFNSKVAKIGSEPTPTTDSNFQVPTTQSTFASPTPVLPFNKTPSSAQPKFSFNAGNTYRPVIKAQPPSLQPPINAKPLDSALSVDKLSDASKKQMKCDQEAPGEVNDTDQIIVQAIEEECAILESEFKVFVKHKLPIKVDFATDKEATNLVQAVNGLQDFLNEILEICQAQSTEVHFLKQSLIQNWACYEEARSVFMTSKDPVLLSLVRAQPLDAVSARQLSEIRHLLEYLESQTKQANAVLDEQWDSFQDYCKKKVSLKLPTMEVIYQSMVKQNATVQKQIYILKDISSRIRKIARTRNIPHLLVSFDKIDALEEQLKHMQINSKDAVQMRYKSVFEKQRQFNTYKSKNLSELLKTRRFNRVCANKCLSNNTMHSNSASLIMQRRELEQEQLAVTQSTPKVREYKSNILADNFKPKTIQPAVNLFDTKNTNKDNKLILTPEDKVINSSNSTMNNMFTTSGGFTFGDVRMSPASAFAPTTQTVLSFKDSTDSIKTSTAPNDSKHVSFAKNQTFLVTSASSALVDSTSNKISFAQTTPTTTADSDSKQLFSPKTSNTATPATKFVFRTPATTTSDMNSSATDPAQKFTFSFSNFTHPKADKEIVSTASSIVGTSSFANTSFPSNFSLPSLEKPGTSESVSITKSAFSYVQTPSSNPRTSQEMVSSTTAADALLTATLFSKPSDGPVNIFGSTTITPVTKSTSGVSLPNTTSKPASQIFITNALSTTTSTDLTSKTNSPNIESTPIPFFPNSLSFSNKISSEVISEAKNDTNAAGTAISQDTIPSVTIQPGKILNLTCVSSEVKSPIAVKTTTAPASTLLPIFSSGDNTSRFPGQNLTITAGSQSNAFQISSEAPTSSQPAKELPKTISAEDNARQIEQQNIGNTSNSSIFDNTITSSSIFGAPAPIFGSVTVTTNTATSILQPTVDVNKTLASTSPSLFTNTAQPISTAKATVLGSNNLTVSSTPQTGIFGVNATSNPIVAGSVFGVSSNNSLFGANNASSAVDKNSAATPDPMFPTITPTFTAPFSSSPSATFCTSNTSTNNFFTTSSSASPSVFGQNTGFGSGSIFSNPASTSAGSIFGGSVSVPLKADFTTATSTSNNVPFGSGFGSNSSSTFGTTNDSFRFSSGPNENTSTGAGSFGFNKVAFTTVGNNSGNTDPTSSFSFGNLGLSTTNTFGGSGFGQNPFAKPAIQEQKPSFTGGSLFGAPITTSTSSIFGGASPITTSTANIFGGASPITTSTTSIFGGASPIASTNSIFGSASPVTTSTNSMFGGTSPFSKSSAAFGGPATFGSAPVFGQQPSGFNQNTFGANSGSVFGSSTASSPFGGANQTLNQSGFGAAPVFNSPPAFGSSSPGGFGAAPAFGAPAFGGTAAFGDSNKPFTDNFGSANQQNPSFGNLASQPTLGFGSLAQQNQIPTSKPSFSGSSSFSNWR